VGKHVDLVKMRSAIYEVSDLLAIFLCGLCEKLRVLCVKPKSEV